MSKYIERIGSKPVKFTFDVQILQVKMKVDTPCFIQVLWKKGSRETRTSRSVWLDHRVGEANFYEVLSLDLTLFQKNGSGQYQLKKSEFSAIHLNGKYEKKWGYAAIDLSELVNQEVSRHKEIELNLMKCNDKNAKIKLNISWSKVGEIQESKDHTGDKLYGRMSSLLSSEIQTELERKDSKQSSMLSTIYENVNLDEQESNQNNLQSDKDYQKSYGSAEQNQRILPYINSTEEDEQEREEDRGNDDEGSDEQEKEDEENEGEEARKKDGNEKNTGDFQGQEEKRENNEVENCTISWNQFISMKPQQDTAETDKSVNITEQNNASNDNDLETNVKEAKMKLSQMQNKEIITSEQTHSKQDKLTDSTGKQQSIIDLIQQKNKISADYRQLRATYQDCLEQLEILQDKQTQIQDVNEDLNLQKKKMMEYQTKQQQQIIQLEQKLALKESLVEKLQKQIEFIQLSNNNLKNGHEETKEVIQIEDLKTKQLENQLYELKKQLEKVENEREAAQKKQHKNQIELQTIEFNHKQLQQYADRQQKDFDRQLDNLKQEILKKEDHIMQMKERLLEVIQSKKKNSLKDHQILESQRGKDEEYIKLLEKREKQMVDQTDKLEKIEEELLQQKQECLEIQRRYQRLQEKMNDQIELKNGKLQELQKELEEIKKDDRYEQIQKYKLKNKEIKEICKKQKLEKDKELQAWKIIVQKSKLELKRSQKYIKNNEAKRFSLELVTTEKQQLQLENQKLQERIEEMSNSTGNESIHRLIEELKKSDGENRAIKEQLISYKLRIAHEEQKVKDSLEVIEEMESQIQELDQDLKAIQKDNLRVKQKYGDALNICLDFGGPELVDLIIKGPDIRASNKKISYLKLKSNHS